MHDHDRNALILGDGNPLGLRGTYEIHELCEHIHAEGAKVLGVYRDDFYAGKPVLTVNELGQGKAYYLAARVSDLAFYEALYGKLVRDAGVRRALDAELPAGVTATLRTDGAHEYVFVQNFSGRAACVELDRRSYTDAETGRAVEGAIELPVNGIAILKREV
ncbi:Beta-galactosidase BglY [compost metagenome]